MKSQYDPFTLKRLNVTSSFKKWCKILCSLQSSSRSLLVSNFFPVVHKRYPAKISKVLFSADDLELFISVTSSKNVKLLRSDLDLLAGPKLARSRNYMSLDIKCKSLNFIRSHNPITYDYCVPNVVFEKV